MTRRLSLQDRYVLRYVSIRMGAVLFLAFGWCALCIFVASGCTSVKGADTARHVDNSRSEWAATTQQSDATAVTRYASTQSSGGAAYVADSRVTIDVTAKQARVEVADRHASTSQPTVITVDRGTSDQINTTDTTAAGKTRAAVTDDTKGAATYSGPFEGALSMDGVVLKSPPGSTFKRRWPIFLGLLIAGLYFEFAPLVLGGNKLSGVGFLAGAAASLILSDFWLIAICAAAVIAALWPYIRARGTLGRFVAQMDDWKSDMHPVERQQFNASLAAAAGGAAKLIDRIRVEKKHGAGPPLVAPAVPDLPSTPTGQ